jgi:hypothetical protein
MPSVAAVEADDARVSAIRADFAQPLAAEYLIPPHRTCQRASGVGEHRRRVNPGAHLLTEER